MSSAFTTGLQVLQWPGTDFTKVYKHDPRRGKFHLILMSTIRIGSGVNFAHATTAGLSWHVHNCDLMRSQDTKWEQQNAFSQDLGYELINPRWNGSQEAHSYQPEVLTSAGIQLKTCQALCEKSWWRYYMRPLTALLVFYEGNPPVTPERGQWGQLLRLLCCSP